MRFALVIPAALLLGGAAASYDQVVVRHGFQPARVATLAWQALGRYPDYKRIADPNDDESRLRNIPPEERAEATRAALAVIKANLNAPEVRALWRDLVAADPRPIDPQIELEDARREKDRVTEALNTAIADKDVTKSKRLEWELQRATRVVEFLEKALPDRKAKYEEAMPAWQARQKDPDAARRSELRAFLARFLKETEHIPWDAKLEVHDTYSYFVDPALEAKPKWWKACFRAGPEPTAVARDFAKQWLKELGPEPKAAAHPKSSKP